MLLRLVLAGGGGGGVAIVGGKDLERVPPWGR